MPDESSQMILQMFANLRWISRVNLMETHDMDCDMASEIFARTQRCCFMFADKSPSEGSCIVYHCPVVHMYFNTSYTVFGNIYTLSFICMLNNYHLQKLSHEYPGPFGAVSWVGPSRSVGLPRGYDVSQRGPKGPKQCMARFEASNCRWQEILSKNSTAWSQHRWKAPGLRAGCAKLWEVRRAA